MKRIFTLLSCAVLSAAAMIAQVPFKVTTIENGEFAAGTTWYTMGIGEGAKLIKDNAGADYITLGVSTPKGNDDELWCFVGNDTEGYAIYNKQAGVDKVLASKTTMSAISGYGGTGGSTYPTMQDAANLPSGYVGRWDFASSNKIANVNGYFMRIHGTNYAVNDFGGRGMLAFWAEGADAGSTIVFTAAEASVEILASTGNFTASNANGTWHSKWESNQLEGFSLSANANNMTTSGDYIAGYSGQSGTCSYTLTAPEGLVIKGYSFDFVNTNNDGSYALTLAVDGNNYTSSATTQHIDVEVAEPARTVYFSQSGANKGITFSNFIVYLGLDIRTPEPAFDVFPTLTSGAIPYRIPAIATAKNGNIIAVADYRHSRADIGMATNGRIDLRARISTDNGETWGEIFDIIQGKGAEGIDASNNDMYVGFGDPAIVADRESDRVLVISCSGNVSFPNGQRNNHQGIAHFYSENCGETWSTPVDRSEHIYAQFDNTQHGPVRAMFVGSGKISQSQYIKVGEYYRIYCAVLVKNVNGTHVNFVLYSDNFGESWTVLGGGEVSPIPSGGDEPKADELPDGSVIISSRTTGGRIYNIFSYTDSEKAEGSWGTAKYSNADNNGTIAVNNSTNGEIMFVPAKRKVDNKKVYLALQSVPLGSGRANVGIYYKELETLEDFISPDAIATDWDGRHQSSYVGGAYSTMTLQHDNNIGFLYEEDTYGTNGGGYTIVYKNYSIEYITDSAYVYDADVDKAEIVAAGIDAKIAGFDPNAPTYVGSVEAGSLNAVAELIDAYKNEPSYAAYEAINAGIANMPRIEVEAGKWYRIRNSERSNATLYLNPEASRVSAAASNASNANQLFTFLPTGNDKEFYLYNGNYQYMLGPLGANETQPTVTTDNAAAGKWKIESTATGLSSIICQNKTGGHTGLHLAGDCVRLVPWTNNAEASLWYIEPVDEFALTIDEYAAVCMPFAMTLPQGVTAYVAGAPQTADGVEYVMLTECGTNVIAANTPVILAATSGTYNIGVGGEATALEADNQLHGVLKSVSIDSSNIYTLSNGELVKRTATSGNIAANTAYYTAESSAETLVLKNIFEATYTLVDQAGNEFNGSFTYEGNNQPTVTGAYGATITDAEMDFTNRHYTATINFAYPMSKVGGATNETLLAINGKYIRAVGNNVKVQTTNIAAVDANCLWAIYPTFSEGAFTFAIMNVATGKYMHTGATSAAHNTEGTIVLDDEATMFTIADNNEFKTGNNLYLSINSPANDTNVFLGLWGNTHNGTDIIDSALTQYDVEVTAAKYATFYAPVAVTVPEGVTAHTVTINGEWATLSEALDVIPAYTGVVLYSETPATYTFNVTNEQIAPIEENALTGTVAATYVTADAYVLSFKDGEAGFYTATTDGETEGTFLNNHHKAYLPKATGMAAASYSFRFEGTTGIENVNNENSDVIFYDLKGNRVVTPVRGIYVTSEGKTVLVK